MQILLFVKHYTVNYKYIQLFTILQYVTTITDTLCIKHTLYYMFENFIVTPRPGTTVRE